MTELQPTKKIKTADGTIVHHWNGIMHNWEGAAYLPQGDKKKAEYYLFGIKYSKAQWLNARRDVNGIPFYKSALGKALGARV
jgi:hypothetical protein